MKKKFYFRKKGFTLIELLAVIVILAIILLIAMPIVLNVISQARKGAFESSVMGLRKVAEQEYMRRSLSEELKRNVVYYWSDGEQVVYPNDPKYPPLEHSGKGPENGYIKVYPDGSIEIRLTDDDWYMQEDADEIDLGSAIPYDDFIEELLEKEMFEEIVDNIIEVAEEELDRKNEAEIDDEATYNFEDDVQIVVITDPEADPDDHPPLVIFPPDGPLVPWFPDEGTIIMNPSNPSGPEIEGEFVKGPWTYVYPDGIVIGIDPCLGETSTTIGGQVYPLTAIGEQCWLAANLNYPTHSSGTSWCYEEEDENCDTYGRLYTYEAAASLSIEGFKVPSDEEWQELESYLGMSNPDSLRWRDEGNIGQKLKVKPFGGLDLVGFNAIPSGWRYDDTMEGGGGTWPWWDLGYTARSTANYWTTTSSEENYAWGRTLSLEKSGIHRWANYKEFGYSVRLIRGTGQVADSACQLDRAYTATNVASLIADGYIPIASASDLNKIREQDVSLSFGAGTSYSGTYVAGIDKKYIQLADIDLIGFSSGVGFVPLGSDGLAETGGADLRFNGIYNGNCYTIDNLTINRPDDSLIGLFGQIDEEAELKNIIIKNADVTGYSEVGGLVGCAWYSGAIVNSYVDGTVKGAFSVGGIIGEGTDLKLDRLEADVVLNVLGGSGWADGFGGIAGNISSSFVRDAHANVTVTGSDETYTIGGLAGYVYYSIIEDSSAVSILTGAGTIGGFVGFIEGSNSWGDAIIANSYANTQITALEDGYGYSHGGFVGELDRWNVDAVTLIRDSYATGTLVGLDDVGGFAGYNEGTIENSFSTVNVSASQDDVGGLVGYNNSRGIIKKSYSTGTVVGNSGVGGLVGTNASGTVTDSYYYQGNNNGIGTMVTESQMKEAATFTNWDLVYIWDVDNDFPQLKKNDKLIMNDDIVFDKHSNSIMGYIGLDKDLVIPSQYTVLGTAYAVISVKDYGLDYANIESVSFPSSLTTIGSSAFAGNRIENLTLPNTISTVKNSAFAANEIVNLTLSTSLTTIESQTFQNNILTSLTIPGHISLIDIDAFSYCEIENLVIESGVVEIKDRAFQSNQITNLSLPNTLTTLGFVVFNENKLPPSQAFIYARNGDGSINNTKVVSYGGAERDNVVIPENVTIIGRQAFDMNGGIYQTYYPFEYIKGVTLPSSLVEIEESAFRSQELTTINFPSTLTTIKQSAFTANELTSVTLPNSVTSLGIGAFSSNQISSVTLSNGLTSIASAAFHSNQITSVIIPSTVTSIDTNAFRNNQLTTISFPSTVSTINATAFERNYLTEIIILRTGTTTMGSNVFRYNGASQNSGTITTGSRCGRWGLSGTTWTRTQTCPL